MIFLTGFPGFLGKEILPRLLQRDARKKAVCLVQDRFLKQAEIVLKELAGRYPDIKIESRVTLVTGDITDPKLGLGDQYDPYTKKVTEVYHFAAVYDLDVKRDFACKVNVDGTQHILDFCDACPKFKRHHYVSTCYVSGQYDGVFTENHLEEGQTFNNFYEETKQLAEVLVRKAMQNGMPTTIYRPSIVTGDSTTGATQKYDGPYYMLRWLMRFPLAGVFPTLGDGTKYTMNIVPRDYIIDAITALSGIEESMGKTYNLADPNPLTIAKMADTIGKALGIFVAKVPLPLDADQAVWVMKNLPMLRDFMGVPTKAIAYFGHPTSYGTANTTRDLAPQGITCPNYAEYIHNIIRFVKANPDISAKAMV
ncbi:MAG: SDR family oxidoreductase [Bacteroidetes bacterium]|nr:SDR family oxidoreductase [Bacteroidota bacterium]